MAHEPTAAAPPEAGWRIRVGGAVFALSIVGPIVLLPLMAAASLEAATTAAISGAILGSAELLGLGAVAIMGKPGFAYLKSRLFGLLKRYAAPAAVGRVRYRIGLALFAVPVAWGWLAPYANHVVPGLGEGLSLAIVGDLMWIVSLFVLGGDFWDKLRALFVFSAVASFSGQAHPGG